MNLLILITLLPLITIPSAYAQADPIVIDPSTPCFLNYDTLNGTNGISLMQECGIEDDFLTFALLPWQWITGGFFSMFIITILVFVSYVKYHKAAYPLIIGTLYVPAAWYLFTPEQFTFGIILAFVLIGILIWFVFVRQTKEYSG